MNITTATRHFTFFSGKSADGYSVFLEQAEGEILSRLKASADRDDERLNTLWGATSAYRAVLADCAGENLRVVSAGSASAEGNDHKRIQAMEKILRECESSCADLLTDGSFIFAGVKG